MGVAEIKAASAGDRARAGGMGYLRGREVLRLEEPCVPLGVLLLLEQDHRVDVPFPYPQLLPCREKHSRDT